MRNTQKTVNVQADPTLRARAAIVARKAMEARRVEILKQVADLEFRQLANDEEISRGAGSLNSRVYLARQLRTLRASLAA